MFMFMFVFGLLAVVAARSHGRATTTIHLSNGLVAVDVSSAGEVLSLVESGASPHRFSNDSWSVNISAYNSTSDSVLLSPRTCEVPPKLSEHTQSSATFAYACDAWAVHVVYSLPAGARYLSKGLSVGGSDGKAWAGTVRKVEQFAGLQLGSAYDGVAVRQPMNTDFHPSNFSGVGRYAGFGVLAQWLGGFQRRATSGDGLFVTVANPFGLYTAPGAMTAAAAFEYHVNATCTVAHYRYLAGPQTEATCTAACVADAACAEFKLKQGEWCTLSNASQISEPRPASGYECGCKGPCPTHGPPAPPPPPPTPLPPAVWAWYEPHFLQSEAHPPVHVAEPAFLGPTRLARYTVDSTSGLNLGEWRAYTEMAESTLLDAPKTARGPGADGADADAAKTDAAKTDAAKTDAVEADADVDAAEAESTSMSAAAVLGAGAAAAAGARAAGAPMPRRRPTRVQVGWDSNDYQIDIGTAAGRAEYQRMLVRDGELGITHAIFAPQNTRQSTRAAATDSWGWEETLLFSMGEQIRRREWDPSQPGAALPSEVREAACS